jgi:hypothetical protein
MLESDMARLASWQKTLLTAQNEALLAARLYNEPFMPRVFEGFVIHMHIAWLYLLQAEFTQKGIDFRVKKNGKSNRFEIVDGEHKTWDLASSARERWKSEPQSPVRLNLEFFIKLRNRIEHRYKQNDDVMLAFVAGKSHAFLLNFEEELTNSFGIEYSLANKLRFPVFIGTFTEESESTLLRLNSKMPAELKTFISEYDASMEDDVLASSQYSFRLRVTLDKVNSDADLSMKFIRDEDLSPAERRALESEAKTGKVIVRTKVQAVYNANLIKPGEVMKQVHSRIPFVFNQHHATRASYNLKVRPPKGAGNPEATNTDLCVFDHVNKCYLYTPSYVELLVRKCKTLKGFKEVTGIEPRRKYS